VTVIVVPYHQDERLSDGAIPLPLTGDVRVLAPELPAGDIWSRLATLDDAAADQIAAALGDGGPTTVVSGDCLVAMAALAGAQRAGVDPGIVWFDAHGDVHTLDTTTSHYLGGLALRLILGAHPELLARPLGLQPVAEDRTLLVGARDLDPAETEYLQTSAACCSRRRVGPRRPAVPTGRSRQTPVTLGWPFSRWPTKRCDQEGSVLAVTVRSYQPPEPCSGSALNTAERGERTV
jgi:hypothetical protein